MKFSKTNHKQLLKHIIRVFPNWCVGMKFLWIRPIWFTALQIFSILYYFTSLYIAGREVCVDAGMEARDQAVESPLLQTHVCRFKEVTGNIIMYMYIVSVLISTSSRQGTIKCIHEPHAPCN